MPVANNFRQHAARRALRQPGKTLKLMFSKRGWARVKYAIHPPAHGTLVTKGTLAVRDYPTYDDYLLHQRGKLSTLDLTTYDREFRAGLAARLKGGGWAGKSVLCLAARIGSEVRAFHDLGAFAVGIDLNPGKDNSVVLPGDFHALVFPDNSVDAVYCNSLDHALDLARTVSEIKRVLKPGGLLLADAQQGTDTAEFDDWAATAWASIDVLAEAIAAHGLDLKERTSIAVPWSGELLLFTKL